MKRLICVCLTVLLLLAALIVPATAKSGRKPVSEVIKQLYRSDIFIEDLTLLAETVDQSNDGAKIFQCVLTIYPDFVTQIKKCSEDDSGANFSSADSAPAHDARYAEAVRAILTSQVVWNDMEKLCDAVYSEDGGKIFTCVLEIYPDLVATIKKSLPSPETDLVGASLMTDAALASAPADGERTDSVWMILTAAELLVVVVLTAAIIVVKRKKRRE